MITPMTGTTTTTDPADQARRVRAEYERELAGIAGDPAMHPAARRIRTAQAFTRATGQLRQLEEASDRARLIRAAADHAGAWRPSDAMAGRDARDRATRITSAADAARQINGASAAGDEDLTKALAQEVVRRAAERPESEYGDVAADYLRQSGVGASVQLGLTHAHAAEMAVEKGAYWLPAPEPLRTMAPFEIHALAGQDVAAAVHAATAPGRDAWSRAGQPRVTG